MSFGGTTGQISEDYGEDVVVRFDGWVRACARRHCSDTARMDDVVQEGRIALWQTYTRSGEISHAIRDAERRIQQMSWYSPPPTGSVHEGPRYEPKTFSVQAATTTDEGDEADYLIERLGLVDHLTDVEWAYHRGEIARALEALNPRQRAYVFARFWCGAEGQAGTRDSGYNDFLANNPQVYDRNGSVWSGRKQASGKRTPGARDILRERLEHLRELVTA